MPNYTETRLWRSSLGSGITTQATTNLLERLRSGYSTFRERAALIAGEIARDLPEYTVHDVTHLDALWEMAELITGPDFQLTPLEGFVLGGSFLIHDLGNGLAAYPEGVAQLRTERSWADTVAALLKAKLGRSPTEDEIHSPGKETEVEATGYVLRNLHAKHAERLALISWKAHESDEIYHLIEDIDLRRTYGPLIGKIAHSHWWNVDRLGVEFVTALNPPPGFPREWVVNPLKIACLLRVADASHLDSRRAPGFLRALRKPSDLSKHHWVFQENLQQPRLEAGRLIYTSGHPFSIEEAPAWWLCFDNLRMVDKELKQVDALLADTTLSRFAARGVAGVDDPARLAKWITTDGWLPVDTQVRISNVRKLVRELGGEQLYGTDATVPLRELIQNATDAIRARRILENRSDNYGDIYIRTGMDTEGNWIEVEDNGIGMSQAVLSGPFLDFGNSFWDSPLMLRELPGLISKGFNSTGKFGIGFFSVFMWGERVRVTTRLYRDALYDTRVLEFYGGLESRPILRKSQERESIRDGGTVVRVWIKDALGPAEQFLTNHQRKRDLHRFCAWLCPALDANLYVKSETGEAKQVVAASDWITMPGPDLIERFVIPIPKEEREYLYQAEFLKRIRLLANDLPLIKNHAGEIVGRACLAPEGYYYAPGVVTVGGLYSSELKGMVGILTGAVATAARNIATPVIDKKVLTNWASSQAQKIIKVVENSEAQLVAAKYIRACGGKTDPLPIARGVGGLMSFKDISTWEPAPEEVLLEAVS